MSLPIYQATYKFLVEGLCRQINADYILEIGLGNPPHTAEVCLSYLKEKGNGLYTVLDFAPEPDAIRLLERYDRKYWQLRKGDTTKEQDNWIFQDLHDTRADLLLIDGSHFCTHVVSDAHKLIFFGAAKDDSIWIFHDTNSSHVLLAVQQICKEFKMTYFSLPQANLVLAKFLNA